MESRSNLNTQVYQFRHHDVTSTAHLVFLGIGVTLIFEVVGYFTNHPIFWALFILFYITFVFVFIIQVLNQLYISVVFNSSVKDLL